MVLIEDASTGSALAQDLRPVLRRPVKLVPIERDKQGSSMFSNLSLRLA